MDIGQPSIARAMRIIFSLAEAGLSCRFQVISPADAEKLVLDAMPAWPAEPCWLAEADGRILRADLAADRDLPPFDRATMDGFALRSSSLAAGVRDFRVEAVQPAGAAPAALGPADDACIEIMTGAPLPSGADCVVPYEEAMRRGDTVAVAPGKAVAPGRSVHRRGGDRRAGEVIVRAGTRLTPREIAVAAACGCTSLAVARLPRIAVVASGDELVEVDAQPLPHQIRRSNDYALSAALARAGFPGAERFHLRDSKDEAGHLLWHLLAEYDLVLLSGGVSKGKFDHLPAELARQGVREILRGVAQRPGKPLWFGASPAGTPVFALPGNPVSTYVCFHRYVLPALRRASGEAAGPSLVAALAAPAPSDPDLARFVHVKLASGSRAELLAAPVPVNTSGDFAGLVGTDGFVELPPRAEAFPAGYIAPFRPWV